MSFARPASPLAGPVESPTRPRWNARALVTGVRERSLAWAGYAAFVWAVAYAVGVRGYQGLGGTVGLAGTFEDPAGVRRASLIAGAGNHHDGVGAQAFVRPRRQRLPPRVVIVPALSGRRTQWRTH